MTILETCPSRKCPWFIYHSNPLLAKCTRATLHGIDKLAVSVVCSFSLVFEQTYVM